MVYLKSFEEIEKIRQAGKILARVAGEILGLVQPGVKLKYLDEVAKRLIEKAGAKPAFLNYRPFGASKPYPRSICASINEVIVHCVPGEYKLKSGDILKLDFGVKYQGYNADAAWTAPVGQISPEVQKLIDTTREALYKAVKVAHPGKTLGDIGYAVQNCVKSQGLKLEPGLVIAIEPMVSAGSDQIIQLKNDSYATADNSLSAHFEHTIAITAKGPQILTI